MWDVFEELLKEKGLSVADVVKGTGVSFSTISNWKMRRHYISPKIGRKIAEFLGVSYDYLTGGEDKESSTGKDYQFSDRAAALAEQLTLKPYLMDLLEAALSVPKETVVTTTALLASMNPKVNADTLVG